uniref:Uncharacterized protein n=1 Tax=Chaetoceros debilis TaxID=122233 RepID=A0A7S3QJX3_9STRA|mmetsp:Transcript_9866/g.14832  ORF Transcript_9866/g.14832 Transcript_9866/m.14832 type:complete len:172 (-) Transcript_9866:130-645(-)|eukprot:CAMPEP_0194080222 /NCGR_PEP_ID=MMETSP0149-20130528/6281_1 /TAXON_ID=122233 /ORGANISM="Chaetoceros debilis, Strain MM31A-1" /LENGTH=171 /DNA_ID=CAMNT_0038761891 /DNA_START=121 /DNA_END=636 /DNA_ORIENTATION=-
MGKSGKKRKPVVVVSTPASAFPDFSKFNAPGDDEGGNRRRRDNFNSYNKNDEKKGVEMVFADAIREVHKLGSTQFTGKQKRNYEAEEYKLLTGREKKKHKVPVKIVRGIKHAAVKREKKLAQSNKDAGIITAVRKDKVIKNYSEKNRWAKRVHGPAPDIGFMTKGKFRVKR